MNQPVKKSFKLRVEMGNQTRFKGQLSGYVIADSVGTYLDWFFW